MPTADLRLTRADFDRCAWEAALADADKKETFSYSMQFGRRLRQAKESGDEVAAAVFTVLIIATDIDLRPDNVDEPFGPRFVSQAARGATPADLTDEQLGIIAELAPNVADPEMRARMSDLVWVMKRDYPFAKKAVDAYLESARVWEDPVNWVQCVDRIRRAVRLAKSLGNGGSAEFEKAIAYTENLLAKQNGEDLGFFSCQLMEVLQSVKMGDPTKYAALACKAAKRLEAEGGPALYKAYHYWHCAAVWHGMTKDAGMKEDALIAAAETYVKQAEEAAAKPRENAPHLNAAGQLERAVHALRKVGTPAAIKRANVVYLKMVEHQSKSVSELISFSHPVDLTEFFRRIDEALSGLTLDEALQRVAFLVTPASKDDLRNQVQQEFARPLSGLFSCTTLGPTGKIVAERPHFESSDEAKERATIAEMYRHAVHHRGLVAQGYLVAAIHKMRAEHNVRLADFFRLAASSSFVPPGRELTFAKGLFAGFTGDLIVSTHLLIPQIEESIRTQLSARGIITSGFSRQNLQNEYDLNITLYLDGIKQLFDDDELFDLRGLLVEHHGSNLRNMMAHGLLDDGQLQSDAALYLWGLTLRLCVMMLPPPETPAGTGEPENGDT